MHFKHIFCLYILTVILCKMTGLAIADLHSASSYVFSVNLEKKTHLFLFQHQHSGREGGCGPEIRLGCPAGDS